MALGAARRLMQAALAALAAPHCSEATRRAVLGALEGVLDAGEDYGDAILRPHTAALLDSLRQLVTAAAAGGGGGGGRRKRTGAAQKVCTSSMSEWGCMCTAGGTQSCHVQPAAHVLLLLGVRVPAPRVVCWF